MAAPAVARPEIFIYYRIAAGDRPEVGQLVAAFQAHLCEQFAGLQARLLGRTEADGTNATLMETYAFAADENAAAQAGTAELLGAIEHQARVLDPWLYGKLRHVEVFEACA